jgi:asparagine synthase (glutamine-hydrolysing)
MAERTIALLHDPRGRLSAAQARARLETALEPGCAIHQDGPLSVGWTGAASPARAPVVALDGAAAPALSDEPSGWLAALRAAPGPFALVGWDGRRGVVARDYMGERPLFYVVQGGTLFAASEVPDLLRLLPMRPAPDLDVLALWLSGRPGPAGATLFSGVRPLPGAHALMLDRASWRLERYWEPRAQSGLDGVGADEAAVLVLDRVRAVVRAHAQPPGDSSVLLSGGLDSSVVLACAAANAAEAGAPGPRAFSVVFPDRSELDESAAGHAVAERWGTPLQRIPAARGPVAPHLREFLDRYELPVENPNGAFFRPALAAAAHAGVLLDGEGGDELFGCEPLLLADLLRAGHPRDAWRLAHRLPGTNGRLHRRSANVILRHWVVPGLLSPSRLATLRRLRRAPGSAPGWLRPAARAGVVAQADGAWWRRGEPRWRSHRAWLLTDWRWEAGVHDRLRREAALTGTLDAHPFLDVQLVELVLGLPPELSFDPLYDRPLVRRAMHGLLPDSVRLRREKISFTVLLLDALVGTDRDTVDATLRRGPLELGAVADAGALRRAWTDGPERHRHGRWVWSVETWRAFAAESWLRREAGYRRAST